MRIIAGEKRRMTLKCPPGEKTRPTTDRVRESLFGLLTPYLADARVLDLFAGAGTLGLEALSRGARHATFVDAFQPALAALNENIERLELSDGARVVKGDVLKFLTRPSNESYDLIFADPPYGQGLGPETLHLLAQRPDAWLDPDGRVILQAGKRDLIEAEYGPLRRILKRDYGETAIHFYSLSNQADQEAEERTA